MGSGGPTGPPAGGPTGGGGVGAVTTDQAPPGGADVDAGGGGVTGPGGGGPGGPGGGGGLVAAATACFWVTTSPARAPTKPPITAPRARFRPVWRPEVTAPTRPPPAAPMSPPLTALSEQPTRARSATTAAPIRRLRALCTRPSVRDPAHGPSRPSVRACPRRVHAPSPHRPAGALRRRGPPFDRGSRVGVHSPRGADPHRQRCICGRWLMSDG